MRRGLISVLICLSLILMTGCAALLEDDKLTISIHPDVQHTRLPGDTIEASHYAELKDAMLSLVMRHEESGLITIYSYDGDVQNDVMSACEEIKTMDPVGAYAVSEIAASVTKIVTYFEVEVSITFQRTKKQLELISNASTLRYLRSELLSFMREYREDAAVRTTLRDITAADVAGFVKEIYYQNPRSIVMLPSTAVGMFPEIGDDRIIALSFGNSEQASIMQLYGESLTNKVRYIAESVGGENDGAILLELSERLMGSCEYDEGTAKTMYGHGAQNFSATAYGALVKGSAVGEGYAMAYKALCDELGFECHVVLGYLDGMVHAWNIVLLYGEYYHIDVSMCTPDDMSAAFLKNDETMPERYIWERTEELRCEGELTYEDIAGVDTDPEGETDSVPEDEAGESDIERGAEDGAA